MTKQFIICPHDYCTGCETCRQICPVQCISMIADEDGFSYPEIGSGCIECGLCKRKCPANQEFPAQGHSGNQKAFCGVHKNPLVWRDSSSGGAASAIYQVWASPKAVFYGVENVREKVTFVRIDEFEDFNRVRGSKYVQASINGCFIKIRDDLQQGVKVVFIGTPCQVAGLKSFLDGIDCSNLLLVDLICHGVGSPGLFKRYLDDFEQSTSWPIIDYKFRRKRISIVRHLIYNSVIIFQNNKIRHLGMDLYNKVFIKKISCRKSCYTCPYANNIRVGDITISDFKKPFEVFPDFPSNKNASTLVFNSEKGLSVLGFLGEHLHLRVCKIEDIEKHNPPFTHCSGDRNKRDSFFSAYNDAPGADERMKVMQQFAGKIPIRTLLVKWIPEKIRAGLKRFLGVI